MVAKVKIFNPDGVVLEVIDDDAPADQSALVTSLTAERDAAVTALQLKENELTEMMAERDTAVAAATAAENTLNDLNAAIDAAHAAAAP